MTDKLNKKEYDRKRYLKNKVRIIEQSRQWQLKNPEKSFRIKKNCNYKKRYGITLDEAEKMLIDQHNRCAVCNTDNPGKRGFVVDHCHDSGKIRGILCNGCNAAIGMIRNRADVAIKIAEYLK